MYKSVSGFFFFIALFLWQMYIYLLIPEKIQTGELWEHGNFMGMEEKAYGNSRGQSKSKKKWSFQRWSRKNHVEFPWVLVFGYGTSKGCNIILQNFQGWSLVFSGISMVKVTKLKIPGFFLSYVFSPPSPLFFWIFF